MPYPKPVRRCLVNPFQRNPLWKQPDFVVIDEGARLYPNGTVGYRGKKYPSLHAFRSLNLCATATSTPERLPQYETESEPENLETLPPTLEESDSLESDEDTFPEVKPEEPVVDALLASYEESLRESAELEDIYWEVMDEDDKKIVLDCKAEMLKLREARLLELKEGVNKPKLPVEPPNEPQDLEAVSDECESESESGSTSASDSMMTELQLQYQSSQDGQDTEGTEEADDSTSESTEDDQYRSLNKEMESSTAGPMEDPSDIESQGTTVVSSDSGSEDEAVSMEGIEEDQASTGTSVEDETIVHQVVTAEMELTVDGDTSNTRVQENLEIQESTDNAPEVATVEEGLKIQEEIDVLDVTTAEERLKIEEAIDTVPDASTVEEPSKATIIEEHQTSGTTPEAEPAVLASVETPSAVVVKMEQLDTLTEVDTADVARLVEIFSTNKPRTEVPETSAAAVVIQDGPDPTGRVAETVLKSEEEITGPQAVSNPKQPKISNLSTMKTRSSARRQTLARTATVTRASAVPAVDFADKVAPACLQPKSVKSTTPQVTSSGSGSKAALISPRSSMPNSSLQLGRHPKRIGSQGESSTDVSAKRPRNEETRHQNTPQATSCSCAAAVYHPSAAIPPTPVASIGYQRQLPAGFFNYPVYMPASIGGGLGASSGSRSSTGATGATGAGPPTAASPLAAYLTSSPYAPGFWPIPPYGLMTPPTSGPAGWNWK